MLIERLLELRTAKNLWIILSDEEKELYIKGLPCKRILEKKGVNPLNGFNVYVLKKINSLEHGFDLLFLLEISALRGKLGHTVADKKYLDYGKTTK